MNRRSTARAWYVLPLILFAISCASTPPKPAEPAPAAPEPEKPPVVEAPAPQIPLPEAAKAAAEKARAEAASYGAEEAFPGEWKAAADFFASGEKAYGTDNAASKASFEAAAKAFEDLAAKAKPLYLDKLAGAKASAERERAKAVDLTAQTLYPEEWASAESHFSNAEKAYGVDKDASRISYEAAARAFKALSEKAKASLSEKIAAAKGNAEKRRKYAFDFNAPTALPADWKAAEALLAKGKDRLSAAEGGALPAYPEALAVYQSAFSAYDDLVRRAVPLFAAERRSELDKSRADAVAAKADALVPSRFAAADAASTEVSSLYARGEHYQAFDAWKSARERYIALSTGSRANDVKTEIERRNFVPYDPGNYERAGERLQASLNAYDQGKIETSRTAAEESHLRYRLALAKGFELYAVDRGKAAEAQRVAAFELKAHVAVKAAYEAGVAVKSEADGLFKAGKHQDAADRYAEAEKQLSAVRQTAAEKRKAAEDAIKEAEKRMQESEKTARDADAVLEGGAR
jgi:hypothetical protein